MGECAQADALTGTPESRHRFTHMAAQTEEERKHTQTGAHTHRGAGEGPGAGDVPSSAVGQGHGSKVTAALQSAPTRRAASSPHHPKLPKVQAVCTVPPAWGSSSCLTHSRGRGKSPGFRGAGCCTLRDAFLW